MLSKFHLGKFIGFFFCVQFVEWNEMRKPCRFLQSATEYTNSSNRILFFFLGGVRPIRATVNAYFSVVELILISPSKIYELHHQYARERREEKKCGAIHFVTTAQIYRRERISNDINGLK